ncbi:S-methyl-5'-thioadenosine phosphorylase [Pseudenhygromyxa sp. WMMC2535]|uniref:S-methyl-5'-thioadenosine phosphorylase n=1 Tax=Pseudenhygromyxa sp. WMMC2535 TaxID=2712867 RepID=UPI0015577896|nr:S-methyl-5'-thioadenosine phosphorylase [Pseudenhygromyxa sp. WMMC2535]NVB41317.1 S-methyl-5'-thioadenosine phosphorylase [Pseudenhygromyxa sp. WMMC2535]
MTQSAPHPASPEARAEVVLGVIGGSGLYAMDELEDLEEVTLDTPFGAPSGAFTVGKLPRDGAPPLKTVFVSRHGRGHLLLPGEINYRANVHGLKQLGVTHLLSASAVGSLREAIAPGHAVIPDQLIDRTKARETSFFGQGCVAHVQFGDPMDAALRGRLLDAAEAVLADEPEGVALHREGTLVVMEGPAFSTRAESELYRSWGANIIGMTALPEAKLAREAEIAYALLATATDYDCWHQSEEEVSVDAVVAVMQANVARVRKIVLALARALPERCADLPWPRAIEGALITDPARIPASTRERLELIVGHYLR